MMKILTINIYRRFCLIFFLSAVSFVSSEFNISIPATDCLEACNKSKCYENEHCIIQGEQYFQCFCDTNPNLLTEFCKANESCSCVPDNNCLNVSYYEVTQLQCECKPGYYGRDCEFETNKCEEYPCGESNKCTALFDDYSCTCGPGFTQNGPHSCNDIDECILNNCTNQSTCVNLINQYNCLCPDNFYGPLCQYAKSDDSMNKFNKIRYISLEKFLFAISGGSILEIRGENFFILQCVGAYIVPKDLPANFTLYATLNKTISTNDKIYITIPRAKDEVYMSKDMQIILDYAGYNYTISDTFRYISNPKIDNISPRKPFINGNVSILVYGSYLNGADPSMTFFVIATYMDQTISGTLFSRCSVIDSNHFTCPFDGFNYFPEDFKNENNTLKLNFNVTISFDMGYLPTYSDNNGQRVNPTFKAMSLGLISPLLNIKFNDEDYMMVLGEALKIKGDDLLKSATKVDYRIKVGLEECDVQHVADNLIECMPPQTAPKLEKNICKNKDAHLVTIGLKDDAKNANVYCVVYPNPFPPLAIFGIVVGCVLVILSGIIIFLCCRHRKNYAKKDADTHSMNDISTNMVQNAKIGKTETDYQQNVVRDAAYYKNSVHNDGFERDNENFSQMSTSSTGMNYLKPNYEDDNNIYRNNYE